MSATVTRFPAKRYTTVAIALHWAIAICIVTQLASGLWMSDAINAPASKAFAFRVFQWHKALGLIVLLLSLARLAWRLTHTPPPLPAAMGRLPRLAAEATHWLFYGLMIGMPLIGWAMVSASPIGLKTMIFGLFEWPHLPILSTLADKKPVEAVLKSMHTAGGYTFAALLVLHIAAALKHHFVDRDDVLTRMWPGPSPARGPARPAALNGQANGAANGHARSATVMPARQGGGAKTRSQPNRAASMPWVLPLAALMLVAAGVTLLNPSAPPRPATKPSASTPPAKAATAGAAANQSAAWRVDAAQSSIGFAGTHTGTVFKGTFRTWSADITFDPANLAAAKAVVTIDLTSAKTGDNTYDGTLPDADWFDTGKTPTAKFETTSISAKGGTAYVANGTLTIRGVSIPVSLAVDLKIDGNTARMTGRTELKRLDFGIGRGSDDSGSWVSLAIPVDITVVATRG